jgi:hypothetical protein
MRHRQLVLGLALEPVEEREWQLGRVHTVEEQGSRLEQE